MESINKDEILSNFLAVTRCSHDEATRYLEAAQWNAETAMEIFFDDGGSESAARTAPTNTQPPATNINQGTSGSYCRFYSFRSIDWFRIKKNFEKR